MSILSAITGRLAPRAPMVPRPGVSLRKPGKPVRTLTESEDPAVSEDRFPENAVDQVAMLPGSPASKAWRGLVKGAFRENRYENE